MYIDNEFNQIYEIFLTCMFGFDDHLTMFFLHLLLMIKHFIKLACVVLDKVYDSQSTTRK